MKLSLSLFLLGCFQLVALTGFSQNKVTLELKNTALTAIIQQIENQTSYQFIYNNDEIDSNEKLNITVFNEDIKNTLNKLFLNSGIRYILKKNHIILSNKEEKQQKFTLRGSIKDAATGETLLGANIIIQNINKGAVTNEYGFYSITLAEGNYIVHYSYIGYASKEVPLELKENKTFNVELTPSTNELDEVVLTSDTRSKSQVATILSGVITLKTKEIKQLPSFLGEPDITRAILAQPGVTSTGEGTSGFNVRGGNIDQNLVLLDEAPLYNSSHLWGLFSVFNADAIKDLKLYKGGIPARYGGKGSSVLDIRQKEGNSKEFKGEGGLGLLFSRLTLEGPLKKEKLSFLMSGRRSYFDLFFPLGSAEIKDNKLYFYDLNTKLSWDINENNKLYASGYFGADVMKLSFKAEELDENGNQPPEEIIDFRWNNATATVRWNHIFSNKLFMNVSAIYSLYNYALNSKNDTGGGPVNTSGSFNWKSSVENWIFKPDFTFYADPSTKMRFGLNATLFKFTPAKIVTAGEGFNNVNFDPENAVEAAPYIEIEKKWKRFSLNAGLRYSWFANIGEGNVALYSADFPRTVSTITGSNSYKKGEIIKSYGRFEPRFSMKYDLNDRKVFKLGYNRMFQYVHLISNTSAALPFDVWKPSGTYVKPLEVNQISMGYAYDTPDKAYNLSLEAYYKTFDNIVEYKKWCRFICHRKHRDSVIKCKGLCLWC